MARSQELEAYLNGTLPLQSWFQVDVSLANPCLCDMNCSTNHAQDGIWTLWLQNNENKKSDKSGGTSLRYCEQLRFECANRKNQTNVYHV